MKNKLNELRFTVIFALALGLTLGTQAENVAEVTIGGKTTQYATLTDAWADATSVKGLDADVLVTMLKDATVESSLVRSSPGRLTLDLNDKVLAYAGSSDACVIHQNGGDSMHIIDTATTRTPRYFTCDDETGLWTLTNEVADLVVSGGLIAGGRAGALNITYGSGPHSISNVNFVGNRSATNGGAVSTTSTAYELQITASTFLGNVAAQNGGAISAAGPCEMTDCRVEANVAGELGGGVYMRLKGSLVRTGVVGNKAGTGGGVYLKYNPGGCFPAGVKILMADGSEKAVEDVAEGDLVATFDHESGVKSSAEVFYVYRGAGAQDVFVLSFASGATLAVADRHDLLLETTRKYAMVSSDNARSFIGRRFYNYATGAWDELVGVTPAKGGNAHYSLYTRGHINCVANGMLTVADDKDFYLNVYELDENLKADAAQFAADIETYGLATPADYPNIPLDDFADGNMRYARIAMGKGLTTQEDILFWNEFDYGPVVAKKAKGALKLTTSSVEAVAPSEPYLQVGEGVVVTGNVNAAGADNVYLATNMGKSPVIDILSGTSALDIGVTLSSGTGVFGWTNDVNFANKFTSDNPDYAVSYTASKTLALRAGVRVGDDAWALIKDGDCTVYGTSDMWSYEKPVNSQLWGYAITNVVIEDAVTSVGTNAFAYQKGVAGVTIGAGVTNVCEDAFFSCLNVTNLAVGAGVKTVGTSAFGRCNSLTDLSFASKDVAEACQGKAFKIVARITMNGSTPIIDAVPTVTIDGYTRTLYGAEALTDPMVWEKISDASNIPEKYHFFKYAYEPVK